MLTLTPLAPLDAAAVISLAAAKAQCRVLHDDEDDLIAGLATQALTWIERTYAVSVSPRAWAIETRTLDRLARYPLTPLRSIQSVTVYDGDNVASLVAAGDAIITARGIEFRTSAPRPTQIARVVANVIAGFDAADTDMQPIRRAALLLIGHWYHNREAMGDTPHKALLGIDSMMRHIRGARI